MSAFQIKTETFEGPLDLLLTLVEKRKFFINDISLAKVADDFIAHTEELSDTALHEITNFLFFSSTLLLIKSRSLLPSLPLTSEEEGNIEDLKKRLKLYERIRELAVHVGAQFGKRIIFPRGDKKEIVPVFSPGSDVALGNIFLSMQNVLAGLPKKEAMPRVSVKKIVSLEDMIVRLVERIKKHLKTSFHEFSGRGEADNKENKVTIIVSFLAVLELVKRGVISANQETHFEDIEIETREITVPEY